MSKFPVETRVLEMSPDRPKVVQEVYDEAGELPVSIYTPDRNWQTARKAAMVIVRTMPWSASNAPEHQQNKNTAYSDALDAVVIAPNTPGQGEGSPDLTEEEYEDLRSGSFTVTGRKVGERVLYAAAHSGIDIAAAPRLVVVGESQGPSLAPAIIDALPENAPLSDIIITTGAGIRAPGSVWKLRADMARSGTGMKEYRANNPDWMQGAKDTDLFKSLRTQFHGHYGSYDIAMASGGLVEDLEGVLRRRTDLRPDIHLVYATRDRVSPAADNEADHALLSRTYGEKRVSEERLRGHLHTVTEDMPYLLGRYSLLLNGTLR